MVGLWTLGISMRLKGQVLSKSSLGQEETKQVWPYRVVRRLKRVQVQQKVLDHSNDSKKFPDSDRRLDSRISETAIQKKQPWSPLSCF